MKCCICGNQIKKDPVSDWDGGNNALPVKNGRCCNDCDTNIVIPTRMKYMMGMKTIKSNPNESFAMVLQTDGQISLYKGKNKNEFSLEELQALVDGLIEIFPNNNDDLFFLVNEEGYLNGLTANQLAYNLLGIIAVGNVAIISKNMLK